MKIRSNDDFHLLFYTEKPLFVYGVDGVMSKEDLACLESGEVLAVIGSVEVVYCQGKLTSVRAPKWSAYYIPIFFKRKFHGTF